MTNNVMVCVTQQKNCERLIKKGKEILDQELKLGKLYVIHVVNEKDKFLYQLDDSIALEYLFEVSKEVDAELIVRRNTEVIETIHNEAKEHKITDIVMGTSGNKKKYGNRFEKQIHSKLKNVKFHIL